jgi:hypothetical protein
VQSICGFRELIAVQDIVPGDAGNSRGKLVQNAREQAEIDMHVDRLPDIVGARPFQHQRESFFIEMASNRDDRSKVPI